MPLVSVIIPCYNAGLFIVETIQSVLTQSIQDVEIIVVDDGSTDDTGERIAEFAPRVTYVYQSNQERSVARNRGISLAQGEFIAFLDADDYWHPTKLEKQVHLFDQEPDLGMVYCHLQFVSPDGVPLHPRRQISFPAPSDTDLFARLAFGNFFGCSSSLVRRSELEKHGGFDSHLRYIEDWEFNLRMSAYCRIGCVPEYLTFYRQHPGFVPARIARHGVQDTMPAMIERMFASVPHRQGMETLRLEALANAWWNSAKIDFAIGRSRDGRDRLVRSLEYDRGLLCQPERFVEDVVDYAMGLYAVIPTPFAVASQFVDSVFQHLPSVASGLRAYHRQAVGRLHAGYLFSASDEEHEMPAWRNFLGAMGHDPQWMRNPGMWSIACQSVLGESATEALRNAARRWQDRVHSK